jgi:hypothetical protein
VQILRSATAQTIEILLLEQVCMSALVLKIFFGKERLVKYRLIYTLPRQGNLLQRNIFQGPTKPLFTLEIGWSSAETNSPFFQTSFFY